MLRVVNRITLVTVSAMAILVFIASFLGKTIHPIPPIGYSLSSYGNTEEINFFAYDIQTGIEYSYPIFNAPSSPNGALSYTLENVAMQMHITLFDTDGNNPRLLGMYDKFNTLSVTTWSPDSQAIFATHFDSPDELILYRINIETGEAVVFGQYETTRPTQLYFYNDDYLLILQEEQFSLLDMNTNELTSYESLTYPRFYHSRFIVYGTVTNDFRLTPITRAESIVHILDTQNLDVITLTPEQMGGGIAAILAWLPNQPLLLILQSDENIAFYNVETRQIETILSGYERLVAWSQDGRRLIIVNSETLELVILELETFEEVRLFAYENAVDFAASSGVSADFLQWSENDRYLLHTTGYFVEGMQFRIYNAQMGDLVYEIDEDGITRSLFWLRDFR